MCSSNRYLVITLLCGWRRGVLEQPRDRTLHRVRLLLGAADGMPLSRVLEGHHLVGGLGLE